ncbi:MAG: polysaccharide deacetylase family protein [Saprospiraceae bacterium]|nr:polysaccharide deacetylase family protein [Saprospiraceae bacterium]
MPANNQAERQYAAEVLLVEWLGLSVQYQFGETAFAAELTLDNGNRLLLEDHFFSTFPSPLSYLKAGNIPQQIFNAVQATNPFLPEKDLPILFGNDHLDISPTEITCGIDIFAATFFMLTRWEEYVLPDRDLHERFPAKASLAGKNGFLHRPVVNEMVEMLWGMLMHLGIGQKRKNRQFEVLLTHDVDEALLWRSLGFFLKKLGGDLVKRLDFHAVGFDLKSYYNTRFNGEKDPYDTFDYLMRCADRNSLQCHFFFLSGGNTKFDSPLTLTSPFMCQLFKSIEANGHIIGLHPSYNTLKDSNLFTQEKEALELATGLPIRHGRHHFLRFEVPTTWQAWEDQGMVWDSTLYYAEQPGFRCGVCYAFPVFNFLTRQKLRLKEVPLTAMEVSWTSYLKVSPDEMLNDMMQLHETVRKYNGTFVLLWHNSSFNTSEWKAFAKVYEKLLEKQTV